MAELSVVLGQMIWKPLHETSLPDAGRPVLLRMKNRMVPARGERHAENDGRSLMSPGVEYGYQVAILRYTRDGFGRMYPQHFAAMSFDGALPEFRGQVPLVDVSHWADLT